MFQIIKQTIKNGCIPACAASVIKFYGTLGDWSEHTIYNMYKMYNGSGFDILKQYLENNVLSDEWAVSIAGKDANLREFIFEKNSSNIPLLCHINQGSGVDGHCVVIADSNENNIYIHDPSPNVTHIKTIKYEEFEKSWDGSFIWFEKIK